ncbi:AAA family ATPase [Fulvivirga sp.]|uniref:ATP-binding protein n=1 Tax=Fulvivirga sp. TaxID=1931237 RepID=UPI0032EC7612
MPFKRHIQNSLKDWKNKVNRKPLILRGARQVGKTTEVKTLSQTYKHSILLNLEKPTDVFYFEEYDDVHVIVEALFLNHNISSDDIGKTLLFIDEIQESPKAIQLLRYFYEEIPGLHVIAAGSLLEFAMKEVQNFPVGRIEYLYMHPMNFMEYLQAIDHKEALDQLNKVPIEPIAHKTLSDLFNRYAIIGGMPEVVSQYLENSDMTNLPSVYESIWSTYKNDIEKYAGNNTQRKVIKHVIETAHLYVDQRIKFQGFGQSNYKSREVSEAMRNLDDAKVIRLIYPTTDTAVPIKQDIKKSPRLQFLDTGLINYNLKIQAQLLSINDLSEAFKGSIIPHLITQELISLNKLNDHKPNFWVREKRQSSAEVDLVYTYKDKVIPIEIKSGSAGKLKSLHQFINAVEHPFAIRMFAGKFNIEEHTTQAGKPFYLMNLPYYLGTKLPEYIDYFISKYS